MCNCEKNEAEHLSELICLYKDALNERDFVTMTYLAGLAIQTLSGMSKASQFVYFLDPLAKCPICYEEDGILKVDIEEWGVCHKHRMRWLISFEFPDDESVIEEEGKDLEKLRTYREVKPIAIIKEEKRISPSRLVHFCRYESDWYHL